MLSAAKSLNECHVQRCATQHKANQSFEKKVKKDIQQIITDTLAGKIKSETEMKQRIMKIRDDAMKHKSNINLLKCSVEQCNSNLRAVIEANMSMMKNMCKQTKDKELCAFIKNNKVPKKLDYESYMKLVNALNELVNKA